MRSPPRPSHLLARILFRTRVDGTVFPGECHMEPTLLVVIATIVLTASGPSNTYAAKTWNDAITNLPCAAFKNTPDEWWITTGTITLGNGSQTWSNVRVGQQLQALPGDST